MVIDHTQDSATSKIFDAWPIPNHRTKAGTRVRDGTERPTATMGSKNQRTSRKRAIAMPRATPTAPARAYPPSARSTVWSVADTSTPSAIWAAKVDATAERGGRKKKGTTPARATTSQATAARTTE